MTTLEATRAEALFASPLQMSQRPAPDEIRAAVLDALTRLGPVGCAGEVAGEFGDHPDAAVNRMLWALTMVHQSYRD